MDLVVRISLTPTNAITLTVTDDNGTSALMQGTVAENHILDVFTDDILDFLCSEEAWEIEVENSPWNDSRFGPGADIEIANAAASPPAIFENELSRIHVPASYANFSTPDPNTPAVFKYKVHVIPNGSGQPRQTLDPRLRMFRRART